MVESFVQEIITAMLTTVSMQKSFFMTKNLIAYRYDPKVDLFAAW